MARDFQGFEGFERVTKTSENTYEGHGIQFRYPAGWQVSEELGEDQVSISVSGDGTAFWTLVLFHRSPPPEDVLDSVMSTFQSEYKDIDIYEVEDCLCGEETWARDIEFVCNELINSAWVRVFQSVGHTVLVLSQVNDLELDETEAAFELLSESLVCDGLPPDFELESGFLVGASKVDDGDEMGDQFPTDDTVDEHHDEQGGQDGCDRHDDWK